MGRNFSLFLFCLFCTCAVGGKKKVRLATATILEDTSHKIADFVSMSPNMSTDGIRKLDGLKLIVFDLGLPNILDLTLICGFFSPDYTLWPFYCDTHHTLPFTKKGSEIVDRYGSKIRTYSDSTKILKELHLLGYQLAVASRTSALEEAERLLEMLDWNKYFVSKQIYPGRKTTHMSKISKHTGVGYSEIVFFDDESRNIRDLSAVNVCSILVENGVDLSLIAQGLDTWIEMRNKSK